MKKPSSAGKHDREAGQIQILVLVETAGTLEMASAFHEEDEESRAEEPQIGLCKRSNVRRCIRTLLHDSEAPAPHLQCNPII